MLRLLVLLLVLANAGYFAWSQGLLTEYGYAPVEQTEPQRLNQQIRPEAMQLLSDADAAPDTSPAPATTAAVTTPCLQAGLFTDEQASALRTRLDASLPSGSWTLEPGTNPGRWIIYMGRYANDEALNKKRAELRQRGITFEPLQNQTLNPGLSLAHFTSEAAADAELERFAQRGVRTAKVLQELPETHGQRLKLAAADAQLLAQLEPLKPALAGKTLETCR